MTIHGSGSNNVLFMHEGSTLIEVRPYKFGTETPEWANFFIPKVSNPLDARNQQSQVLKSLRHGNIFRLISSVMACCIFCACTPDVMALDAGEPVVIAQDMWHFCQTESRFCRAKPLSDVQELGIIIACLMHEIWLTEASLVMTGGRSEWLQGAIHWAEYSG